MNSLPKIQKSLILRGYFDKENKWHDNNDELNELLKHGWKVVVANPMGAFGTCYGYPGSSDTFGNDFSQNGFASVIILQKDCE